MNESEKIAEEKIFLAATQIFEEKGMAGARMQEIADRAGINKAMLHYYFRSKDKLFEIVFDKLALSMFEKMFACFDNDLPLEKRLGMFYDEHIAFLQKHPRMPNFILHEINQNPERISRIFGSERFTAIRDNFFREIDEEIAAGTIKNVDKMQLLVNIIALSVFPFAARGLLNVLFDQHHIEFDDFIEQRKNTLPPFIMNALKDK